MRNTSTPGLAAGLHALRDTEALAMVLRLVYSAHQTGGKGGEAADVDVQLVEVREPAAAGRRLAARLRCMQIQLAGGR